jgi:hypothetical protein
MVEHRFVSRLFSNHLTYLSPQTVTLNSSWQRFPVSGTVGSGLSNLSFQIGGGNSFNSGQTIDVWGPQLQLRTVDGPYIATDGLPVVVGSQPTNILPNTQTVNGPSWVEVYGSITATNDVAPDGSSTGLSFTASSGSTDSFVSGFVPNPSLYDSQQVTASVFLRTLPGVSSQQVQLYLVDQGTQYSGSSIAGNSPVVTLSSTWQRYALTATLENGLSQLSFQIGGERTVMAGQGFEMWGPQSVVGSDPAPYTPTNSTTTVYATQQPGTLVPTGLNQIYAYDSFGNILQNGSFTSSYTASNQIFGYAYDAAGNLL